MTDRITPRVVAASRALADELGVAPPAADEPVGHGGDGGGAPPWRVERDGAGLALVRPDGVRLRADLASGRARGRVAEAALAGQPLARALGIRRLAAALDRAPWLVDATAGLGVDAWQAAALGARVTMLERDPVVHALLADGLARARASDDERARRVAGRVALERVDAADRLEALADAPRGDRPELVYLDPMYPPSRRRGRSRKGIEFLHELLGPPADDGGALLDAALRAATRRVVVKRPAGAPAIPNRAGARPDPVASPNTRWDRYAVASGVR